MYVECVSAMFTILFWGEDSEEKEEEYIQLQ